MQIGGRRPRYTSVYASVRNVPAEVMLNSFRFENAPQMLTCCET